MNDNVICRMLGIRYPILAGGMTWVSEAVLAAAMGEAGVQTTCRSTPYLGFLHLSLSQTS